MKISEYLQRSREERTRHIDLSTPCVLTGVKSGGRPKAGRRALLALLGVEDDIPNWRAGKVCCAHLCDHHSKNGWCTNPLHFYVGTVSENQLDKPEETRKAIAQAAHQQKDELGRSVTAVKASEAANKERDDEGKSVNAARAGQAANRVKTEDGRSVNAVRAGKKGIRVTHRIVWVSLCDGLVSTPANVVRHNKAMGTDSNNKVQLTPEEAVTYTPLFENFEYTTYSTTGRALKRSARRVPEHVLQLLRAAS